MLSSSRAVKQALKYCNKEARLALHRLNSGHLHRVREVREKVASSKTNEDSSVGLLRANKATFQGFNRLRRWWWVVGIVIPVGD